ALSAGLRTQFTGRELYGRWLPADRHGHCGCLFGLTRQIVLYFQATGGFGFMIRSHRRLILVAMLAQVLYAQRSVAHFEPAFRPDRPRVIIMVHGFTGN